VNALDTESDRDWSLIESTSPRINTHIRKLASEKTGSRCILPAAAVAIASGACAA